MEITVLHIGTNNAATDSTEYSPQRLHQKLPKTKVNISSLVKTTHNTEKPKTIQKKE